MRAAWSLAALSLACSSSAEYRVRVIVPGGGGPAARVEVSVLGSCLEVARVGDPPSDPIRIVEASAASAPRLGSLAPGSYGLYARAWDDRCTLFAAGCDSFDVTQDGGTIDVVLAILESPEGCQGAESCVDGDCVQIAADGGADAAQDAGCTRELALLGSVPLPDYSVGVAASGSFAFVATAAAGLSVVDLSEPEHPVQSTTLGADGRALGVSLRDDVAYVANGPGGLWIVGVADPLAPESLGVLGEDPLLDAQAVFGLGDGRVCVAGGINGVAVIDAADERSPRLLTRIETFGVSYDIEVSGDLAYVADGPNGLRVIDLGLGEIVGRLELPEATAYSVAIHEPYAFVATHGGGLYVAHVGDPALPAVVAQIDELSDARGVALLGDTLLVASEAQGVAALDLSAPEAPVIADSLDLPGSETAVGTLDPYVLVAAGSVGLHVLSFECPR